MSENNTPAARKLADVCIDARIDASIVQALSPGTGEPFWDQSYTNTIFRVRLAAVQSGKPEPTIEEISAVLANDTALENLFEAGAAATAGAEDEANGRANRKWLDTDWRRLETPVRETICEGIRTAARTRVPMKSAGGDGTVTTRRNPWTEKGELVASTKGLPPEIKAAIQRATDNALPAIVSEEPGSRIDSGRLVNTAAAILDTIDDAVAAGAALSIITGVEQETCKADIRRWRERATAKIERRSVSA